MLNVAPNTEEAGIWMSGGAPSVDSAGHLYVITGNGTFDATNTQRARPMTTATPSCSCTPGTGRPDSASAPTSRPPTRPLTTANDQDFGAGGAALVLNLGTGTPSQHLVVGGGKDGGLYVLNGDHMGGSGDANAWQMLSLGLPHLRHRGVLEQHAVHRAGR